MTKRCEACKFNLQDEYSYRMHIQGKKHLKNIQHLEFIQSLVQRSIFVSRIPNYISSENLIQFFSQFDEILKYHFGPSYVIIEFKTIQPVKYLLTQPIYFSGIRLNICPRNINDKGHVVQDKNNVPEAINDTEDLIYDNIKSIFEVELSFDAQLAAFIDKVAISNLEIETRYEPTCKALNKIFRNVFPNCKTYRFGSTVSGLGFKNCDLDIFMETGFPVRQDINSSIEPNLISTTEVFSKIKRILYAKSAIFTKVFPIPKAKTPIIKFTYIPTKISCDISFKNSLAIHNSQLIKFYLSLHPCLKPTMMILKYWVCNYELKERNKMSKYALTILFIFYLQQPTVKLVPPVIDLKKQCVPQIVEDWQINFDEVQINQEQNNKKNISVPELLHGFFNFYANYNFKSNVISCVDGLSHDKILFNEPEKLPESMDRYKTYLKTKENPVIFSVAKPMCVQDPNELNNNITANVCARYLENFQKYCDAANKICENAVGNNYRELLSSIFSLIIKMEIKKPSLRFCMSNLFRIKGTENIKSQTDEKSIMNESCFNLVFDLIKKYFEHVLKFQVQFINQQEEIKQQKTEIESDVHSKNHDKIIMHCVGNYCLWKDRKNKFNNIFDPNITLLEKEIDITKKIFEELNSKNRLIRSQIDFECHISKKRNNNGLILVLIKNNCTKQIFSELANYIKFKMPDVLTKTFLHMQQYDKKDIAIKN